MATGRWSRQFGWLLRLVVLSFAGVQCIAPALTQPALAQSPDGPWTVPLNLSQSGAATNPTIVIDSDSVVHAVWLEDNERYVYAGFDGNQWSNPQQTDLHLLFGLPAPNPSSGEPEAPLYSGPNPFFMDGPGPYITAFWLTPEGGLYTSRVFNRNFMDVAGWRGAKLLSDSAASFSAGIDSLGELHLAYVRTIDDSGYPAGIYYLHTRYHGQDWSSPTLLYESPYYRTLRGGEANLSLATTGTSDASQVYIAWDNRARKQVFLAISTDGGTSWGQSEQKAGPAPGSGLAGPFNIRVGTTENSTVLVWQSTDQEGTCAQFFQSSSDAGATWSQPQPMAKELLGCAQANEFVAGPAAAPGDFLYLLTNIQDRVYLSAWNGIQWSEPQAQPILSGFEDPEIYTRVELDCHRAASSGGRLYIVGCDQGRGGDIWTTSLDVETMGSWFSPQVWSQPVPVIGDELDVAAVELVATEDNLIHAVFSQRQDTAIYYTRWDGTNWSRITPVMQLSDGEAGWPAIASGPGNELFLIARSSQGSLYFSQANSSDAVTASGWSTPTRLPIAQDGKVNPADIAWDATGRISIAYSIPVNTASGVYLVQSVDQGKTWSEPLQVFDGAAADFGLVGSPSLLAWQNGLMYITWRQYSIQGDGVSQPLSLYCSRSEDAGQTFSKAEIIVDAPVTWGEIETDSKGNLHRLWQRQDTTATMWDQVSFNGGHTWQGVQLLPADAGTAAVTQDPVGRLHLLSVGIDSLSHWLWDGNRWQAEAPLRWSLAPHAENSMELPAAAAVNNDGTMVALFAIPMGADEIAQRHLYFSTRTVDQKSGQTAIQETLTPPARSPTHTPTTSPPDRPSKPTATVSSSPIPLQDPPGQSSTGDSLAPFAKALFPVALLLLSVLGVVVIRGNRNKDR